MYVIKSYLVSFENLCIIWPTYLKQWIGYKEVKMSISVMRSDYMWNMFALVLRLEL